MSGIRLTRTVLGEIRTERLRARADCACGSPADVTVADSGAIMPTTLQVGCGHCGFAFDGMVTDHIITTDPQYWYDLARQAKVC